MTILTQPFFHPLTTLLGHTSLWLISPPFSVLWLASPASTLLIVTLAPTLLPQPQYWSHSIWLSWNFDQLAFVYLACFWLCWKSPAPAHCTSIKTVRVGQLKLHEPSTGFILLCRKMNQTFGSLNHKEQWHLVVHSKYIICFNLPCPCFALMRTQ